MYFERQLSCAGKIIHRTILVGGVTWLTEHKSFVIEKEDLVESVYTRRGLREGRG